MKHLYDDLRRQKTVAKRVLPSEWVTGGVGIAVDGLPFLTVRVRPGMRQAALERLHQAGLEGPLEVVEMTIPRPRAANPEPSLERTLAQLISSGWGAPITGGIADGHYPAEFSRSALLEGMRVELEHTADPVMATRIAMDHLLERADYYERLRAVEANPVEPVVPYRYPTVAPIREGQLVDELAALLRRSGLVGDGGPTSQVWLWDPLDAEHGLNPRRYAQVIPDWRRFEFARATLQLPYCHRLGLLAHEVGHVLAPEAGEDGADQAAREILGVQIGYDRRWPGKGLQVAENCPR